MTTSSTPAAASASSCQCRIERPADLDHALRDVVGLGAQPAAASRRDDDRLHRFASQRQHDTQQRARRIGGVHHDVGVQKPVDPIDQRDQPDVARVVDDEAADRLDQRERRAARRRRLLREAFAVVAGALADGRARRGGVFGPANERRQADGARDRDQAGQPLEQPAGIARGQPQPDRDRGDERERLQLVHQEVEVRAHRRRGPLEPGQLSVGAVEHVRKLDDGGAGDERAPARQQRQHGRARQEHGQRQQTSPGWA